MAATVRHLAGGFYGLIYVFKGDLDYNGYFFRWPRTTAVNPCAFCPCDNQAHNVYKWSDFRTNPPAAWMRSCYTPAQFAARFALANALLSLPGVTVHSFYADWMHCKYLGSDQYLLGSILWMICYQLLSGQCSGVACWVWVAVQVWGANAAVGPIVDYDPGILEAWGSREGC